MKTHKLMAIIPFSAVLALLLVSPMLWLTVMPVQANVTSNQVGLPKLFDLPPFIPSQQQQIFTQPVNSDFEATTTAPWETYRANLSLSTQIKRSGNQSLMITVSTAYTYGSVAQTITGLPVSQTVYVELWLKGTANVTQAVYIRGHNTNDFGNGHHLYYYAPLSDEWSQQVLPYTVDSTGILRIVVDVHGSAPVYVDDVKIYSTDPRIYLPSLVNSNFERGVGNWYQHGPIDLAPGHNSTWAIRAEQTRAVTQSKGFSGIQQNFIRVTPNQTYTVSGWFKWENIADLQFRTSIYDSSSNLLKVSVLPLTPTGSSTQWEKLTTQVTMPANASYIKLHIWHGLANDTTNVPGSVAWIDDVTFEPTCTTMGATLCNSNFEQGLIGWQANHVVTLDTGHKSNNALKSVQTLGTNDTPTWQRIAQTVTVIANQIYLLEGWLKWQIAGQAHMKVIWYDSGNNWISEQTIEVGKNGNGDWQLLNKIAQAPANVTKAVIEIVHGRESNSGPNVSNSTIWVDDVTFKLNNTSINHVGNGNFEQGATLWSRLDDTSITTGRTGQGALVTNYGTEVISHSIRQLLPGVFKVGKTYQVSTWCKADSGERCQMFLGDANEILNPIRYENDVLTSTGGNGQWQFLAATVTLTQDEWLDIYLYAPILNSTVYYDDVTVAEVSCDNVTEIPTAECNALVALYNSTGGANWITKTNWLQTNQPCSWYGVTCSTGYVTKINISNNNAQGTFPDLHAFTHLSQFSAVWAKLDILPEWIGDITTLTQLNLGWTDITGTVPSSIGNLVNLTYLSIGGLSLKSPLPPEFCNLTNISELHITNNTFYTGELPSCLTSFNKMKKLRYNNANWCVPNTLAFQTWLQGIADSNFTYADTPWCQTPETFACATVSQIPQNECQALTALYTSTNGANWITKAGWLQTNTPCNWYGVTCSAGHVKQIIMENNNLKGIIPKEIGNFPQLTFLSLKNTSINTTTHNIFVGGISVEIANLTSLDSLQLNRTSLTGTIPIQLGSLSNLRVLGLSDNQLTGTIPVELGQLSQLEHLYLGRNQLTGSIPTQFSSLTKLQVIGLDFNQLTGVLPDLSNLHDLWYIDLNKNGLSGGIPTWLGGLTQLQTLGLQANQFTGTIPIELGNLTKLITLTVAANPLTGTIPPQLGNLAQLRTLNLANSQLNGTVPSQLSNLANLQELYLNQNPQLIGSLPSNFSQLTKLAALGYDHTNLCEPTSLNSWLNSVPYIGRTNVTCPQPLTCIEQEICYPDFSQNLESLSLVGQAVISSNSVRLTPVVTSTGGIWFNTPQLISNGFETTFHYQIVDKHLLGADGLAFVIQNSGTSALGGSGGNMGYGFMTNSLAIELDTAQNIRTNPASTDLNDNHISIQTGGVLTNVGSQLNSIAIITNVADLSDGFIHAVKIRYVSKTLEVYLDNFNTPVLTTSVDLATMLALNNGKAWVGFTGGTNVNDFENHDILAWQFDATDTFSCANVSEIPTTECQALTALYTSTNGANWFTHTNWLETNTPCSWYGVMCSHTGHVIRLYLNENNLVGNIPAELNQLTELTLLRLYRNKLSGVVPLVELSKLSKLEELSMATNQLSGTIPPQVGNLTNLKIFSFGGNKLTGTIPIELGKLVNLTGIGLDGNKLTGTVPNEFGNLSKLTQLWLENNPLTGTLPLTLTNAISMSIFRYANANLCTPNTATFHTWLQTIAITLTPAYTQTPWCQPQISGLVINGDFEQGLLPWEDRDNAGITTTGRTGNGVAISYDGGNSDLIQVLPITLPGGTSWRATAWCKAAIGEMCRLYLGDGGPGIPGPTEHFSSIEQPGTGDWQELNISVTLGQSDERMSVYLYSLSPNSVTLYDDVTVEQIYCDNTNWVCNGNFESRNDFWFTLDNTRITPCPIRSGNCMEVSYDDPIRNSDAVQVLQNIARQGEILQVSVWCLADVGEECQIFMGDAYGSYNLPTYENFVDKRMAGTGQWQYITGTLTLTRDEQLSVWIYGRVPGSAVIYDEVKVEKIIPNLFIDSGQNLTGAETTDVALGDIDGDGDIDAFITAPYAANKVWLNDGRGILTASGQNPSIGNSHGVALADLDKDGDLDAFVIGWPSLPAVPSTVWFNDGQGKFIDSTQRLGNSPTYDVDLGDVDGDGDLDAVIGNNNEPSEVWLNDGLGYFNDSGQRFGDAYSYEVTLADVDKDGDLDLFRADAFVSSLWLNDGSGHFTSSPQGFDNVPSLSVAVGDVDKDGDLDAVFAKSGNKGHAVWLNDGAGKFSSSGQKFGSSVPYYNTLGDFDGDGDLDLYAANHYETPDINAEDLVWQNNGHGFFTDSGQRFGLANQHSTAARAADLDGDKDLDMVVIRYYGEPDVVLFNQTRQPVCNTVSEIPQSECNALIALYNNTNGANWITQTNWLETGTPCSWYGITCNNGYVTNIDISKNNAMGTFPDLRPFSQLKQFSAFMVKLDVLPSWIGEVKTLEDLNLGGTGITDTIPSSIGQLTNLIGLSLGGVSLKSPLPAEFCSLTNLTSLHLSNDSLYTGELPSCLTTFTKMQVFHYYNANWCVPNTPAFHTWLQTIPNLIPAYKDTPWCTNNLFIVTLAFDNDPTGPANLAPFYEDTMQGLIRATQNASNKTVVVLTDLGGVGNTFIQVINKGKSLPVMGLPDNNGVLQSSLNEYDMANGLQLGGFLKWARQSYATPTDKVVFSFVAHGAPLFPETPTSLFFTDTKARAARPISKGARPHLTDHTSQSMISPHDLAQALQIGTQNGQYPFEVADLLHCFSGSFEELHQLAPFAKAFIASPNYGYFDYLMPGGMVQAVQPTMTYSQTAITMMTAYDKTLPDEGHPRLFVALDGAKLLDLKISWDNVAVRLLEKFDNTTKTKLKAAYEASGKYDTTYCAEDWALTSPDALVDLGQFTEQLIKQFGIMSKVGQFAEASRQATNRAVIAKIAKSGIPWYAPTQPTWTLNGSGLAVYADLVGTPLANNQIALSFHSYWYTSTITADNPAPYSFIQNGVQGATWATVFNRYWSGSDVIGVACLPKYPPVPSDGELTGRVSYPLPGYVTQNSPTILKAVITNTGILYSPLVKFTVWQNNTLVFTEVVAAGRIMTGTHEIATTKPWTPTILGDFTIMVEFDVDQRIREDDETNNIATTNDSVLPTVSARPKITAQVGNIWVNTLSLPLSVQTNMELYGLGIQVYQYQPGLDPNIQVPVAVGEAIYQPDPTLPNFTLDLPTDLKPGIVVLHVYGYSWSGASVEPAIVQFNYIPANSPLARGQYNYFILPTLSGITHLFNLQSTSTKPSLFIWHPYNLGVPTYFSTQKGVNPLIISAPFSGKYVVAVYGQTATSYSLGVSQTNARDKLTRQETLDNPDAYIPTTRPQFQDMVTVAPVWPKLQLSFQPPSIVSGQTILPIKPDLVWIPVLITHVLPSDDIKGFGLVIQVDDRNKLKPDCTHNVRLATKSIVPTDNELNSTCKANGWYIFLTSQTTISKSGQIVELPFYAKNEGTVTLTFSQSQISNGLGQLLAHDAVSSSINLSQKAFISGKVSCQTRASCPSTKVTLMDSTTRFITRTDTFSDYHLIIPEVEPTGKNLIQFRSHLNPWLFLPATRTLTISPSQSMVLNVCLWAGEMDNDGDVDRRDWSILSAAIFPVSAPSFDLNGDGQTNMGDLTLLYQNIGRANSNQDAPCTNQRLAPVKELTPQQTTANLTLQSQSDGSVALYVQQVQEPIASIGLQVMVNTTTVTTITTKNHLDGGFLHWEQVGSMVYIVVATNEDSPLTQEGEILHLELAEPNTPITLGETNIIGVDSYIPPKSNTYLPLIVK